MVTDHPDIGVIDNIGKILEIVELSIVCLCQLIIQHRHTNTVNERISDKDKNQQIARHHKNMRLNLLGGEMFALFHRRHSLSKNNFCLSSLLIVRQMKYNKIHCGVINLYGPSKVIRAHIIVKFFMHWNCIRIHGVKSMIMRIHSGKGFNYGRNQALQQ